MYEYRDSKITYILVFAILIFIDQLSKYIVRYLSGFYICNPNISFGIRVPDSIFWIFWLVIIGFLIKVLFKKHSAFFRLFILLILSGAVSNIIDRLYFGCVIDFIDLKIWPVLNLADIYITLGAIMLIIIYKKHSVEQK